MKSSNSKLIILLLITFYFVSSCSNSFEYTNIHIEGIVIEKKTQLPIKGATLKLTVPTGMTTSEVLTTAMTDENGNYVLNYKVEGYCPESILLIHAIAQNYYSDYYQKGVDSAYLKCIDSIQHIDFELKKR